MVRNISLLFGILCLTWGCGVQPPSEKIPVNTDRVKCEEITWNGDSIDLESLPKLLVGAQLRLTGKIVPTGSQKFREEPTDGVIRSESPKDLKNKIGKVLAFWGATPHLASRSNPGKQWDHPNVAPIQVSKGGMVGTFEIEISIPPESGTYELRIWADSYDPYSTVIPPDTHHDLIFAQFVEVGE